MPTEDLSDGHIGTSSDGNGIFPPDRWLVGGRLWCDEV